MTVGDINVITTQNNSTISFARKSILIFKSSL